MRSHSYENKFHLQVHFHANQTHFHLNGFARRLVLKLRQGVTQEWAITWSRVGRERGFPELERGGRQQYRNL